MGYNHSHLYFCDASNFEWPVWKRIKLEMVFLPCANFFTDLWIHGHHKHRSYHILREPSVRQGIQWTESAEYLGSWCCWAKLHLPDSSNSFLHLTGYIIWSQILQPSLQLHLLLSILKKKNKGWVEFIPAKINFKPRVSEKRMVGCYEVAKTRRVKTARVDSYRSGAVTGELILRSRWAKIRGDQH